MKSIYAVYATLLGAALLAGSPALADERCPSDRAAAGLCAPLHFVDSDRRERAEARERRAYEQGYRDARRAHREDGRRAYRREVAPPRRLGLDGKEGYSQSIEVHRQYLGADRQLDRGRRYSDRDNYDRRRYDRDDDDRRYRRDDVGSAVNLATDILRGLSN